MYFTSANKNNYKMFFFSNGNLFPLFPTYFASNKNLFLSVSTTNKPFSIAGKSHKQLISIGHNFLYENLLIILLPKRSTIIGRRMTYIRFYSFQSDNFKRCFRGGTRLCGNHPSETGHTPRAHVIVLGTHGHQVFFWEGDLFKKIFDSK